MNKQVEVCPCCGAPRTQQGVALYGTVGQMTGAAVTTMTVTDAFNRWPARGSKDRLANLLWNKYHQ